MTTNTLKVLRAAANALERVMIVDDDCDILAPSLADAVTESSEELRTLIASLEAQPVGEPVAFRVTDALGNSFVTTDSRSIGKTVEPLYIAPVQPVEQPKAVPLTLTGDDLEILNAVQRELDDGGVDAPGHAHTIPGVWDSDNGPKKAGKPCAWCLTWSKFTTLIAAHGIGGGND